MTNDKALMLAVKAGQTEYVSVLFENHHIKLFNYFIRMGNSASVSEDLVQETFIRLLTYRETYQGENEFLSWLYRIAKNAAIDLYRKNSRNQQNEAFDEAAHSDESDIGEKHENDHRQLLFEKALAKLEPEQREIIILSRYQQMKYEDIADMFGCNLNTLKTRMRAAIRNLKKEFDQLAGASI